MVDSCDTSTQQTSKSSVVNRKQQTKRSSSPAWKGQQTMHHIHITHAKAVEFLQSCEALEGFISSDSILGRLMIAMRAALAADGVSVDVWQGDTSIPKNTHIEALNT
jgi:hypothetical protein